MRRWPGALKTPPYVTAKPEVTHRTVSIPALSPGSASSDKSTLRFLVLATDGLWDQLSSEDVVALVGGHLSGLKGSIPKSDLPKLVPTSTGTAAVEGKGKRREPAEGTWAFVDDNPGTHLIRNALGGANNYELRKMLSIPAPYSNTIGMISPLRLCGGKKGRRERLMRRLQMSKSRRPNFDRGAIWVCHSLV